jgi:hypothetical protein
MEEQLKRGQISVNKKAIQAHVTTMRNAIKAIDNVMAEKESFERGKKIARITNSIEMSVDFIEHFQLKVPFKK